MAYSSIHPFIKGSDVKVKRSDGALKTYSSADMRIWSYDCTKKALCLQEILKKSSNFQNNDTFPGNLESLNREELIAHNKKLMLELAQKNVELDKMHQMFKTSSQKLETLNEVTKENQKYQNLLRDSEIMLEEQKNTVKKLERERSEMKKQFGGMTEKKVLKNQLKKLDGVESLLEKLKTRAEEADLMEKEIENLKLDVQRYRSGASGDKIKLESIPSDIDAQKYVEMEAERNFLRQKVRCVDVLEAEWILYKTKYEEAECKLMALKEMLIKSDFNERQARELQAELKEVEKRLQESEEQNQNHLNIIERLDLDLKERDLYINSINGRLSNVEYTLPPKNAIEYESSMSITSGKVQSIVRQISEVDSRQSNCKCGIDSCQCAAISKTSVTSKNGSFNKQKDSLNSLNEAVINCEINKCDQCTEIDSEQISGPEQLSFNEIRILRQENAELDKELKRIKEELSQSTKLLAELEMHRKSNNDLENELSELQAIHSRELEKISCSIRSSVCEKVSELHEVEQKLCDALCKINELEENLNNCYCELKELRELRACYEESYKECECDKEKILNELSEFKNECAKGHEDICNLKNRIQELEAENAFLKNDGKPHKNSQNLTNQRDMIKQHVTDFKRHYEEKALMIKCYEKKIQLLEAENESLKCFRDKYLRSCECPCEPANVDSNDLLISKLAKFGISALDKDELTELHDRVRCAVVKLTKKPSLVNVNFDYAKTFELLCKKFNFNLNEDGTLKRQEEAPVRDDFDACSARTVPHFKSARNKRSNMKKKLSRSSDFLDAID